MKKRDAVVKLATGTKRITFKEVDTLPSVGDFWNREEITDITKLELAGSQPYFDNTDYDFYVFHTTFNGEVDEYPEDIYICYLKGEC